MEIVQKITLDLSDVAVYRCISAKQNDDLRKVQVALTDHGQPYTIPSGATAQIRCGKPDGHIAVGDATVSGNTVTASLTEQMLAAPGRVLADIVLQQSGKDLSTASFVILVDRIPGGAEMASTNEFLELELAHQESLEAAQRALDAAERAEKAAADAENPVFNDAIISTTQGWTSDKIIKSISEPFEVTGGIVSCTPMPGSPLEITADLTPRQDGAGVPSPDNLRPIRFWNTVALTVSGKNLVNLPAGDFTWVRHKTVRLHPGDYTASLRMSSAAEQYQATIIGNNGAGSVKLYLSAQKGQGIVKSFHLDQPEDVKFSIYADNGYSASQGKQGRLDFFQLEIGTTKTEYEPFAGTEYAIDTQSADDPVCQGAYEMTSGNLTASWAGAILDGSPDEAWREDGTYHYLYSARALPYAAKQGGTGICNLAEYKRGFGGDCVFVNGSGDVVLTVGKALADKLGGLTGFVDYIKTHPLEIAYETAPYHRSIGAATVSAITGKNYVFSEADTITVSGASARGDGASSEAVEALRADVDQLRTDVDVLLGIPLPDYFQDYIAQKAAEIDTLMSRTAHGDAFIFVTDNHLKDNTLHSFPCMRYLLQNTALGKVIYNGDAVAAYGTREQMDEQAKLNRRLFGELRPYASVYLGRGNHDFAIKKSASENTGYTHSSDYAYHMLTRISESHVHGIPGKCYFWFENPTQKIRYICLDTQDVPIEEAAVPAGVKIGVSQEQLDWLASALNDTHEGWSVLVYGHVPIDGALYAYDPAVAPIRTMLQDYKHRRGAFAQAKGELVMYLCGHNHRDQSTVSDGVLIVSCLCDARYAEGGFDRTLGTTNEIAFDAVILDTAQKTVTMKRIGAGNDREFQY